MPLLPLLLPTITLNLDLKSTKVGKGEKGEIDLAAGTEAVDVVVGTLVTHALTVEGLITLDFGAHNESALPASIVAQITWMNFVLKVLVEHCEIPYLMQLKHYWISRRRMVRRLIDAAILRMHTRHKDWVTTWRHPALDVYSENTKPTSPISEPLKHCLQNNHTRRSGLCHLRHPHKPISRWAIHLSARRLLLNHRYLLTPPVLLLQFSMS